MATSVGAVYDAARDAEDEAGGIALKVKQVNEGKGWEISIVNDEQHFKILLMKDEGIVDVLMREARKFPVMTEGHLKLLRVMAEAVEKDLT